MPTFQRIERETFDGYDSSSGTQRMEVGRFVRFKLVDAPADPPAVRMEDDVAYLEEDEGGGAVYILWGKRAGAARLVAADRAGQVIASAQIVVEDKPITPWVKSPASATPEASEGNRNTVVMKSQPMIALEIAEPAEITEQAQEKRFEHRLLKAYVAVESKRGTSHTFALTPDAAGVVRVPVEDASRTGMLSVVRSEAGVRGRCAVIWKDDYDGKRITAGQPAKVTISSRLRFSLMSIVPCLLKAGKRGAEIDEALVDKVGAARIDDLWLVATIRPRKNGADFSGVEWAQSFRPMGITREDYLRGMVSSLGKRKVRLIVGYAMVNLTKKKEDMNEDDLKFRAYLREWIAWIKGASDADIEAHAKNIVKFFDDQQIQIGGIGFDLEADGLNESHAGKLGLLFERVSGLLASRNGIVGYANAPFTSSARGVSPASSMSQPFSIAARAPNILAWPMCYDGAVAFDKEKVVKPSIAYAIRPANVDSGGGLHPSQLQYALWCPVLDQGKDTTVKYCNEVLRPNKIGLMVYTMPSAASQSSFLDRCKQWEAALNPGQPGLDEPGKPLQVPACTPGGPTPFAQAGSSSGGAGSQA